MALGGGSQFPLRVVQHLRELIERESKLAQDSSLVQPGHVTSGVEDARPSVHQPVVHTRAGHADQPDLSADRRQAVAGVQNGG